MISGVAHRHQRQPALAGVEADKIHGGLDRDRVDVGEHYIHQLNIMEIELCGLNKVIVQADFSARQDIPDISKLYVPNASGKLIQVQNFLNEKM